MDILGEGVYCTSVQVLELCILVLVLVLWLEEGLPSYKAVGPWNGLLASFQILILSKEERLMIDW
jgi:hypothetical protein